MSKEKEYAPYFSTNADTLRDVIDGLRYSFGDDANTFVQAGGEESLRGVRFEDVERISQIAANPSDNVPAYRIANGTLFTKRKHVLTSTDNVDDAEFMVLDLQVVIDMKCRVDFNEELEEAVATILERDKNAEDETKNAARAILEEELQELQEREEQLREALEKL